MFRNIQQLVSVSRSDCSCGKLVVWRQTIRKGARLRRFADAEGDSMGQGTRNDGGNEESGVFPDSLAWDAMIRDAKKRIEELQLAIEIFEKKKAAGERWPGSPSSEPDAVPRRTM